MSVTGNHTAIEARQVVKRYGSNFAVKHVSFQVKQGDQVAALDLDVLAQLRRRRAEQPGAEPETGPGEVVVAGRVGVCARQEHDLVGSKAGLLG